MSVFDPFARCLQRRNTGGKRNKNAELSNLTNSTTSFSPTDVDEEDEGRWIKANRLTVMGKEEREKEMEKITGVGEPVRLLRKLNEAMRSVDVSFPSVEVKFDNLTVTVEALVGEKSSLPSVVGSITDAVLAVPDAATTLCGMKGVCGPKREEVNILDGVSGVFRPGTTTLVLGPPGAGKSVLLRTLAGRFNSRTPSMRIDGDITFNGVSALTDEFCVPQVASLVDQTDCHVATLTTRETLEFARRCQGRVPDAVQSVMDDILSRPQHYGIDPDADPDWPAFQSYLSGLDRGLKTELILNVLLLTRCADTVVGDAMLRGVSGGERRRVTTGEMLVGTSPVKLFDEISTGLDSASTFSICRAICSATKLLRTTTVVALLQPQPETYELFDEILLLTDGRVIYQGPPDVVLKHFATLDFVKPPMKDTADFLQEVTTPEGQLLFRSNKKRRWRRTSSDDRRIITVEEFADAYLKSDFGALVRADLDAPVKEQEYPLTKEQYKMGPLEGFSLVLGRELRIVLREKVFIVGRMIQTTVLGAIIGTLFWQLNLDTRYINFYGIQFFTLMSMSFSSVPQLSLVQRNIKTFYKQRDAHFFSAAPYGMTLAVVQIPQQILETLVFCSFVYWFTGMAPSAAKYFTYMLVVFTNTLAIGSVFRGVASWTPRLEIANAVAMIFLMYFVILSGFSILRFNVPDYVIWLYYLSPFAYSMRALAVNEFSDSRWQDSLCVDKVPNPAICGSPTESFGDYILKSFGMFTDTTWIWVSVGYNCGFYLIGVAVCVAGLALYSGTRQKLIVADKKSEKNEENDGQKTGFTRAGSDIEEGSAPGQEDRDADEDFFAIKRVELVFRDLRYFVIPRGDPHGDEIELLKGVTGFACPGTLTALMGASGAGKSTLMDCIAGRKTTGRIEGEILMNGSPKDQRVLNQLMGYCEQTDIHTSGLTVQESLIFSARMRLPRKTPLRKLKQFVNEQMKAIELDKIANNIVGLPLISGLSVEQRKRLTIGVELAANPSIVFMDEPTSGLDARAAAIVMRNIKQIGLSGRSILCTIHQPSREIFSCFDSLLLLKRGGSTIFFGDLGEGAINLTSYLSRASGIPYSKEENPANYMLEASTESHGSSTDFAEVWVNSSLSKNVDGMIQSMLDANSNASGDDTLVKLSVENDFAASEVQQLLTLSWKWCTLYWRKPAYNAVRLAITAFLALTFGAIYWDLGTLRSNPTAGDIQNIGGALFASILFIGATQLMSILPVIGIERLVFYRERAAGLYRPIHYHVASGIAELPYIIVQSFLYSGIVYWMIYFRPLPGPFFTYALVLFFVISMFVAFGQLAAYLTPDTQSAMVMCAGSISLWALFLGFVLPRPDQPWYWRWISYIDPLAWAFQALLTDQVAKDSASITISSGASLPASKFLDEAFGFEEVWLWPSIAILFGFVAFFRTLGFIAIQFVNHQVK